MEKDHISSLRPKLNVMSSLLPLPKGVDHRNIQIGGTLPAEWLRPHTPKRGYAILFLHGGGYSIGSVRTHRGMAGKLAQLSGLRTLLVDYRKSPEHPFPAALEDAVISYQWLLKQGYHVLLAGDSAGGGLCIALQVLLKQMKLPLPVACSCFSPWVDLGFSSPSIEVHQQFDPVVQVDKVKAWAEAYAGEKTLHHPLVSPLFADLKGLAPLLIHASTTEVLTDDAVRLAKRAKKQGVEVQLKLFPSMQHVWQLFWFVVPEAKQSLSIAANFLVRHMEAYQQALEQSQQTDSLKKSA